MCNIYLIFLLPFFIDISFLFILKKQNPEKFKRLYERLVTPSKFGGPVPTQFFSGSQEFFKDFIITAENHNFNVHLKDVFIAKITDLNKCQWPVAELEEKGKILIMLI